MKKINSIFFEKKLHQGCIRVGVVHWIIGFFYFFLSTVHARDLDKRKITVDSDSAAIFNVDDKYLKNGIGPKILDDNLELITTTFDQNTPYSLEISKDSDGKKSILLSISRQQSVKPGLSEKSKIELNVLRADELRLSNGMMLSPISNGTLSRLSFDLKIDKDYEIPKRWVLHFQVFQCCADESGDPYRRMQPPLALQVDSEGSTDSSIAFFLMVRDDRNLGNARSDNGNRIAFLDGASCVKLKKEKWYRLSFTMRPNPDSKSKIQDGLIIFDINGQRKAIYNGVWGYSDGFFSTIQGYALKLGIYRAAQPTLQKIEFRNIEWEKL